MFLLIQTVHLVEHSRDREANPAGGGSGSDGARTVANIRATTERHAIRNSTYPHRRSLHTGAARTGRPSQTHDGGRPHVLQQRIRT